MVVGFDGPGVGDLGYVLAFLVLVWDLWILQETIFSNSDVKL